MKNDVALAVAGALSSTLVIFNKISQQPLRAVWQSEVDSSLDRIVLNFDRHSLIVSAASGDDTMDFEVVETPEPAGPVGTDVSETAPWRNFIGSPFGWGWVAVNQQGYCDTVLLSFGDVVPRIMLTVVASSIKVADIGLPI